MSSHSGSRYRIGQSYIDGYTPGVDATPLMKSLDHLDQIHMTAAQGWLELSNIVEASEELDQITATARAHPGEVRSP